MRKIYKRKLYIRKNNMWVKSPFTKLKKGDTFKVFDENNKPIPVDGEYVFIAYGDPQPREGGGFTVQIEE
jgi:hypothetical protein